jgi:hypothetical protein
MLLRVALVPLAGLHPLHRHLQLISQAWICIYCLGVVLGLLAALRLAELQRFLPCTPTSPATLRPSSAPSPLATTTARSGPLCESHALANGWCVASARMWLVPSRLGAACAVRQVWRSVWQTVGEMWVYCWPWQQQARPPRSQRKCLPSGYCLHNGQ